MKIKTSISLTDTKKIMETTTLQQKRRRKALLVLPLPVTCFAAILFHVLGGGTAGAATSKRIETVLNKKQPDSQMKKDQPDNKLAYYNQAAADSAREKQLRLTDPYGGFNPGKEQIVNQAGSLSFSPRQPDFAAGNSPQANARKIAERLNTLQQIIYKPDRPVGIDKSAQLPVSTE